LITENPFGHMKGVAVRANRDRDYFVTRADVAKVLDACPDNEWKLLFVLSRYGGLRCPSEHMALSWGDINWERERIVVHASKTEHHEGDGVRIIPLFPEIRPYLEAVYEELLADFDPKLAKISEQPVIARYRTNNTNLRSQLKRIIKKAGLIAWPKLFQNLRASRATELAGEHPGHVAADWLGHSTAVADKHYWQTTDDDFARALHNAVQQPNGTERNGAQEDDGNASNSLDIVPLRSDALQSVVPLGHRRCGAETCAEQDCRLVQ
jgi:integrase